MQEYGELGEGERVCMLWHCSFLHRLPNHDVTERSIPMTQATNEGKISTT